MERNGIIIDTTELDKVEKDVGTSINIFLFFFTKIIRNNNKNVFIPTVLTIIFLEFQLLKYH